MRRALKIIERMLGEEAPWIPPPWIPRHGDGFFLSQNTECYGHAHVPTRLYEGYAQLIATCFNHPLSEARERLSDAVYDFLVAISTPEGLTAAACMVRFCQRDDEPYLFIASLCTDPDFRGRGLAHQLVHAVYTLGVIVLEQSRTHPQFPIPAGRLYIALTVRKDQPAFDRIRRIYSQCGLDDLPMVTLTGFRPYVVEDGPRTHAMFKSISPHIVYADEHVSILRRAAPGKRMYMAIPDTHAEAVRRTGVAPSSALHPPDQYTVDTIQFTDTMPSGSALCVWVQPTDRTAFILRIPVPCWMGEVVSAG